MRDVFLEKLIRKDKSLKDYFYIFLIIDAAILAVYAAFFIPLISVFAPIVVLGIVYITYYLITQRNIEFEYILTNGELDVDKIVSKRKRKRIFNGDCRDFDFVAKITNRKAQDAAINIKNRIEAVISMGMPDVYLVVTNYKGKKTALYFQPGDKIFDAIKLRIPSKVFQ